LGYHVWRLLTKQDANTLADIQDSEEVVHKTKGFCCCLHET